MVSGYIIIKRKRNLVTYRVSFQTKILYWKLLTVWCAARKTEKNVSRNLNTLKIMDIVADRYVKINP